MQPAAAAAAVVLLIAVTDACFAHLFFTSLTRSANLEKITAHVDMIPSQYEYMNVFIL